MTLKPLKITFNPPKLLPYIALFWCKRKGRSVATLLICALTLVFLLPDLEPFKSLRHSMFDIYQTALPRPSVAKPVWIVEIDEASLAAIGQWPWPRNYLSALIDGINALHPAAIGLDIIMPEPDHASPHALAESRTDLPASTIDTLRHAVSNDHLLADSLAQAPSVLGVAGLDYATPLTQKSLPIPNIVAVDPSSRPSLRRYSDLLPSLPELQSAARGQGLLSAELERGVLRKATMLASVNNTFIPNFGLEIIRTAKRSPEIHLQTDAIGVQAVRIGDVQIPLQSNGESWLYFDRFNRTRYISALKVFNGEVTAQQFENQIVIVGLTGLGLQDMVTTPHGDRRVGIESHVQFIESALNHQTILRPIWMPAFELSLFLLIAIGLVQLMPNGKILPREMKLAVKNILIRLKKTTPDQQANAQDKQRASKSAQVNKAEHVATFYVHPTHVIWVMLGFTMLLLTIGFGMFVGKAWLFDAANIWLGLTIVILSLYISSHMIETHERHLTEKALFEQRLQAAKINGEMEAASKIQLGTLPDPDNTFPPDEKRFEITAFLEPVRHVGGDLYDFFMRDEQHLFFVIGDVSGKGMPASLLMVVTKALMKNAVLRDNEKTNDISSETLISQIVSTVNTEMTRENPQMLFVTGVAGLLNLTSGELAIVNAGHDAPWIVHTDGTVARLEAEGNPPLGVMDEFEFSATTYHMQPGEALFMVTDGVTEAMDIDQTFYTVERVTATLSSLSLPMPPKLLVDAMKAELRAFVGEADAADDITMLSIRWLGA